VVLPNGKERYESLTKLRELIRDGSVAYRGQRADGTEVCVESRRNPRWAKRYSKDGRSHHPYGGYAVMELVEG
jgi:hypothetical protein